MVTTSGNHDNVGMRGAPRPSWPLPYTRYERHENSHDPNFVCLAVIHDGHCLQPQSKIAQLPLPYLVPHSQQVIYRNKIARSREAPLDPQDHKA